MPKNKPERTRPSCGTSKSGKRSEAEQRADVIEGEDARDEVLELETRPCMMRISSGISTPDQDADEADDQP